VIASRDIDGPMMLWLELQTQFQRSCAQAPPPLDLLRRMWRYALWCMQHPDGDVRTAAALAFCEHLLDTPACRALLPQLMTRREFENCRDLLLYHNTEEQFREVLRAFDSQTGR
jgi:hypothetical protein